MKSLDTEDVFLFGLVTDDPLTIKLFDGTRVRVLHDGEMRIPVKSHTYSGAFSTVRRGKTLVEYIVI